MDTSIRKLTPNERAAVTAAELLEKRKALREVLKNPDFIALYIAQSQARPTLTLRGEMAPRAFIKDGKVETLTFNLVNPPNGS